MAANQIVGDIPLGEKLNLSLREASVYTGIGINRLKELASAEDAEGISFRVGRSKLMFRREPLEEYLANHQSF